MSNEKVLKMKDAVKRTIEIDVPEYWERKPDPKYDQIRKDIKSKWALVKFCTGKTAEEWLWEADSHLYDNGGVAFLDATKALENAVEAMLIKLGEKE